MDQETVTLTWPSGDGAAGRTAPARRQCRPARAMPACARRAGAAGWSTALAAQAGASGRPRWISRSSTAMPSGRRRGRAWPPRPRCRWTTCAPWSAPAARELTGPGNGCARIRPDCGQALDTRSPAPTPCPDPRPSRMTATFAPALACRRPPRACRGRFAASVRTAGSPRRAAVAAKRNCSITPRQLLAVLPVAVCGVAVIGRSSAAGRRLVLAFAGVELRWSGWRCWSSRATPATARPSRWPALAAVEQQLGRRVARATSGRMADRRARRRAGLAGRTDRPRPACRRRFLRPELRAAFARELRRHCAEAIAAKAP